MRNMNVSTPLGIVMQRLMTRRQVEQALGISRSTIYARQDPQSPQYDPHFPRAVRRGTNSRSIAFLESEIQAYIRHLIDQSRTAEQHPTSAEV